MPTHYEDIGRFQREGPAPLAEPVPGMSERDRLHVAVVVPPFRRGSGGHSTIFRIVAGLEGMGHICSIWVHDPIGRHHHEWSAALRGRVVREFTPVRAPAFKGFGDWYGADVVVATGWETVHPVLLLPHCRARAYLVNDHEPEFFPTSSERLWAEDTYRHDLYCISASRWLCELLADRYGAPGTWFRLGVDHTVYRPRPGTERRDDTVIFYGRDFTPRRAVPLGVLALEELWRRRPDLRLVSFGQDTPLAIGVPHESLGVAGPPVLAARYAEATVGLCLSLTNYSLVPQEMMACGLPCVDVAGVSAEGEFGRDGPVKLAEPTSVGLADAVESLLEDADDRRRRAEAGLRFVEGADWDLATRQVERGLREALARRERAASAVR